ncbi:MAG: M23 family metallopeptidase [Okeania sp. SIO3I5]|uniref:M23 family metallopeptidase n=1 Tax=Okeania sp. SIO3I5 TaxID=2607805 RepID=UPI0013B98920|nr:M23 family metallopeptidase [Okeania sp. SIO3I5]NEQ40803.1 M23 family metallopeptidase [Okeania sp. SIO3I5]
MSNPIKNPLYKLSTTLKQGLRHPQKKLLLLGFIVLGIATLGVKQELVKAQEAKITNQQITYVNNWQNASFPVENFQGYTSPFGPRGGGFHYGLDLAAPLGSYIRSWWTGKVVEVWEDRRCGTGIIIQSGYWEHVYCHVQGSVETRNGRRYLIDRGGGIMLLQGQVLPAGSRIARVGMTGRTSGPHLHWGLKYGGRWVDPGLILREMYAQQNRQLSRLERR